MNFATRKLYFVNDCKEYLWMVSSKTTSTKACKLWIVCIKYFSQKARWLKDRTRFALMKRSCVLFLFDYSFKGKESSTIWINFNFSMRCRWIDRALLDCELLWSCIVKKHNLYPNHHFFVHKVAINQSIKHYIFHCP